MWVVLCTFIALPLLLVAYLELGSLRRKRMLDKFQGPSMMPVMGNAHQLGKTPTEALNQLFTWWHALLEIKTALSKIVRNFHILPALDELVSKDGYISTTLGLPPAEKAKHDAHIHKYDPILSAAITLKSENGLHLRMKSRH